MQGLVQEAGGACAGSSSSARSLCGERLRDAAASCPKTRAVAQPGAVAQKWGPVVVLHATSARRVRWEASRARWVCKLGGGGRASRAYT